MKKIALILCFAALAGNAAAQKDKPKMPDAAQTAIAKTQPIKPDATPLELAEAAVKAHGGEKFTKMKSLTQVGIVDVSPPGSTQSLSVGYKLVSAGAKFRFEINSPFANFQQIHDGETLYSSMGGADVPPFNKLNIFLLTKIGERGYKIEALPDKKKRRGFRMTTPDAYVTDFYLDAATGQVVSSEATFKVRNRDVSTAVEYDKFKEVEGVLVPEKFSQRFDLGGNTFYGNFKAKETFVNTPIADEIFALPQQ